MGSVINTNVGSLTAQRNLVQSQSSMQTSLQRLSSGLRINSAKDDAAGLAISERFTSQIRGLNQAVRNANDGVSLAQTAEGALQEISTNLQRIRELAVQGANGTLDSTDRDSIKEEVEQLTAEIKRVADTEFNGQKVIGASLELEFQVGADEGETISVTTANVMDEDGLTDLDGYTLSDAENFGSLISVVDDSITSVNTMRSEFGAVQNRFESVVRNAMNVAENLSASRSRILDADFAAETASLTRSQILQQAGTAMLAQANAAPQSVLSLLG